MKTKTNKSIKTKKAGLLLATDHEPVNTLKPANSCLDSMVW